MAVPQPPRPGAGAIPQSPSRRASQQPLPQQFPPDPPGLCATAAAALTTSSDSAPRPSLPPLLENKPAVVAPIHSDEERDVDSYLMEADGGWDVREVGVQDVQVGSLAKCMQFWRMMGASRFIQTIVLHGYALPFIEVPRAREFANHRSACENAEFVCDSVESLLNQGCIQEVKREDVVVTSPLGVVNNGKKLRLIVDLRYVNKHLQNFKFKLEDMKVVANVYSRGDYLVTFDLKSGYHHIEIAKAYWKYLGFSWVGKGGDRRWFVFRVLPFGLSTAPYIFTKVTRVLLRHWRRDGIRCQLYMDDGSGGHSTVEGAQAVAKRLKSDLVQAGFVPNENKCHWEPSQTVEMLGMEVDMREGIIRVTKGRVEKLKTFVEKLSQVEYPTARQLARLTGYLLSMSLALGPVCRLRTRSFYALIMNRESWHAKLSWSQMALQDLEFWSGSFSQCHGQPFWKKDPRVTVLSWSDASDSGWGGFSVTSKGTELAKGEWTKEIVQAGASSTWRELRAILLVLSSLSKEIEGGVCIHRSDNQAAVHIIQVGSSKSHLQSEALEIHKLCAVHGIQLLAEWVPREENELADYLSKLSDTDDWQLNPKLFDWLDSMWGPHSIDCFASSRTKQMSRFCSRWWNPGCSGIDAFTVNWSGERVWLVPPMYLIGRVVDMLIVSKCHGTLVVPEWQSAPWWPKLRCGPKWADFVKEAISLPKSHDTFLEGTCPYNFFGGSVSPCDVYALRICTVTNCVC